ncbi:hypothetical protein AB0C87_25985 [Actinomadura sp. NPDC048021]|uniref:hypothetical protein n=1 Tax=Actinomadura sp. NPDC048021 TaxID=3155385 RepID=UPI0033CA8B07
MDQETERVESIPLPAMTGPRELAEIGFNAVENQNRPVLLELDRGVTFLVRPGMSLELVTAELEWLWPRERTPEEFVELAHRLALLRDAPVPVHGISVEPGQTLEQVFTALLEQQQKRDHPRI